MTQHEVKNILAKQLQLLSEKSIDADSENLARLSEAMGMLANAYLINYSE